MRINSKAAAAAYILGLMSDSGELHPDFKEYLMGVQDPSKLHLIMVQAEGKENPVGLLKVNNGKEQAYKDLCAAVKGQGAVAVCEENVTKLSSITSFLFKEGKGDNAVALNGDAPAYDANSAAIEYVIIPAVVAEKPAATGGGLQLGGKPAAKPEASPQPEKKGTVAETPPRTADDILAEINKLTGTKETLSEMGVSTAEVDAKIEALTAEFDALVANTKPATETEPEHAFAIARDFITNNPELGKLSVHEAIYGATGTDDDESIKAKFLNLLAATLQESVQLVA